MIKAFNNLSEQETKKLYEFIMSYGHNHHFSSFNEFTRDYSGPIFDFGQHQFSFWAADQAVATLAMITKDIEEKGEVFITGIYCSQEFLEKLELLVIKAVDLCQKFHPKKVKLGISDKQNYLIPVARATCFSEVYKSLVMRLETNKCTDIHPDQEQLEVVFLSEKNKLAYKEVSNQAFITSPNGSILTDDILTNLIKENVETPELVAILMYQGKPAGIYELTLKGSVGWIESLGIHPDFQGKGLGRILLFKAINQLYLSGAKEVKLYVMSSNERAVQLYQDSGFVEERIGSTWFEREMYL